MKKIVIPYIIIAFAFAATLIALGIYLVRFDLAQMLLDSLENTGIAGMIIYIVLYIPLLLIRISTVVFIIIGILYLASIVLELIFLIKNKLSAQKIVMMISMIFNSVVLYLILSADMLFIRAVREDMLHGSTVFIIFTVLVSVLCVALEVISAVGFSQMKNMQKKMLSE